MNIRNSAQCLVVFGLGIILSMGVRALENPLVPQKSLAIEGDHFTGTKAVRLNGRATSFNVESDQKIRATIPSGLTGHVTVIVDTPDGAVEYQVNLPATVDVSKNTPNVQSIRPNFGTANGGTEVQIMGKNFNRDMKFKVLFDGAPSPTVTFVNPSLLTAMTPPHLQGRIGVVVEGDNGLSLDVPEGFEYRTALSIQRVNPPSASARGGVSVTLEGAGFLKKENIKVVIGGLEAEVLDVNQDSKVLVRVPAHVEGDVDVVVSQTDEQVTRLEKGFRYVGEPTIKSIHVE